jgi:hypothetical protein
VDEPGLAYPALGGDPSDMLSGTMRQATEQIDLVDMAVADNAA